MHLFNSWLSHITLVNKDDSLTGIKQKQFSLTILLSLYAVALIYLGIAIITYDLIGLGVIALFFVLFIVSVYYLFTSSKVNFVGSVILIIILMAFAKEILAVSSNDASVPWLLTFPAVAIFYKGRSRVLSWLILYYVCFVGLFITRLNVTGDIFLTYARYGHLFLASIFLITVLFFYSSIVEKTAAVIEKINEELKGLNLKLQQEVQVRKTSEEKLLQEVTIRKQMQQDLSVKLDEIRRLNKLMIDREHVMIQMKEELKTLRQHRPITS
jgi:hypothetical protein